MAGVDPYTTVSPTGDADIDGVLGGSKWPTVNITYAFPDSPSDYNYTDPSIPKPYNTGFSQLNTAEQNAVKWGLDTSYGNSANDGFAVSGFTNAVLTYTTDDAHAMMRVAESGYYTRDWTYLPGPAYENEDGDTWLTKNGHDNPIDGQVSKMNILHELAHGLGLKHPHEANGSFGTMPTAHDALEYTLMSYKDFVGDAAGPYSASDFPQSYMMYDIAALQKLYGANFTVNSDDTVYSWHPTDGGTYVNGVQAINPANSTIFMTVWDGGGNDTYDLSAFTTDLTIDLTPGGFSRLDGSQLANLGGGHTPQGEVYNALQYQGDSRSLIENIISGTGSDTLTGNAAANNITSAGGNDNVHGNAANDIINGNAGDDVLHGDGGNDNLKGGSGQDVLHGEAGADRLDGNVGNDILDGGAGADTFVFTAGTSLQGQAEVLDFTIGTDKIEVSGGWTSWASLSAFANDYGTDCVISTVPGTSLRLDGIHVSQLSESDFVFV